MLPKRSANLEKRFLLIETERPTSPVSVRPGSFTSGPVSEYGSLNIGYSDGPGVLTTRLTHLSDKT